MSAFQRKPMRFVCQGVGLTTPLDAMLSGKFPILQNVRSYVQGEITPRNGIVAVGSSVGATIHSIERFDDSTPFAVNPHLIVLGVGTNLRTGPPAGNFNQIDTGYSGNPLSMLSATPPNSPQPWLYIADANQYRKIDANGHVYGVGIAPPVAAPDVRNGTGQLGINIIAQFASFGGPLWTSVGAAAGALGAMTTRTGTTVSQILYDAIGGTPGYASVVPTAFTGIGEGELLYVVQGANQETTVITEVTIAVATTTIAGILYDAGNTGLCTIQPAASLGTGQLSAPSSQDYAARANTGQMAIPRGTAGVGTPAPTPPLTGIRQTDFPVNSLVSLGNVETVRILSVALGPDGVLSFRCLTNSNHAVGESIVGLAAFRCFLAATYTAGAAISDLALTNTITVPAPLASTTTVAQTATAGVRSGAGQPPLNLALINGRSTLPDDDVHLTMRFNNCPAVQTVRLYLSLEPTAGAVPNNATDFTQNYYFFEWRATDIIAAIQNSNTDNVASLQAVQPTIIGNAQLNQAQPRQRNPNFVNQPGAGLNASQSSVIAAGNLQWLELRCKVRDLTRIGTDPSTTLANVTAAEILVDVQGSLNGVTTIQVNYDAIWISGGYGPDVGATGTPYVYRYRYRSSLTGAVSNPSPANLGGVIPRRQYQLVAAVQSADPQVDLVDFFRLGGVLTTWTYLGTIPNAGPTLTDVYPDSQVAGGETLSFTEFQPWPTQDLPRSGTCNVVGSAIQWVSGATFNTQWAPGSTIIVNNKPFTLYAQPSSATRLVINDSAGVATGVPFTLPGPTLMGKTLGSVWGGSVGGATFLFACRDATNPGQVHWSTGNNTEASTEQNTLDVTPATEPLQNGFMYDGLPYVASTDQVYVLEPNFGTTTSNFRPLITPCGRGFWAPWAFALAPEGCYFLAKDGIYLTAGGGVAEPITDADLYPLFPHDGVPGIAANGYLPPDMTQTTRLRLAYVDGWLYFDYKDTNGVARTLAYRRADKSWWPDQFPDGVVCRSSSVVGAQVHQMLVGANSQLAVSGGASDLGNAIPGVIQPPYESATDVRATKLWGDYIVKLDGQNAAVTLSPLFDDGTVPLTPVVSTTTGLQEVIQDLNAGLGQLARNFVVKLTWSSAVAVPIFHLWEPSFVPKVEIADERASDWDSLGNPGAKQIRALRVWADTLNQPKSFQVQGDGGAVLGTFTPTLNGEQVIAFPIVPFITHLVRIVPTDGTPWRAYNFSYDFDLKPELIAEYTDWNDLGDAGTKFVRGLDLHVDTGGGTPQIQVQKDDGTVVSTVQLTATTGEDGQAFSFNVGALQGFYAHVVRLVPLGPVRILNLKWTADPKPSLMQLITDWTDAGYNGDKSMFGLVLHVDTNGQSVSVQVQKDDDTVAATVVLAASTGEDGQPFSFDPPFYAHILRLVPLAPWRLLGDPNWIFSKKPELIAQYTDWVNGGSDGAKFMQGLVIHVDTGGSPATFQVQYDDGAVGATITLAASTGEDGQAFSFPVPFWAHVLRIAPTNPLRILGLQWVFEPEPELALLWEAQPTTFDMPGFLQAFDMLVAHRSTADLTLTIYYDGVAGPSYTIPNSGGAYAKTRVIFAAGKGLSLQPIISSTQAFRLYKRDITMRAQAWGGGGGYTVVKPFGGNSRVDGAAI